MQVSLRATRVTTEYKSLEKDDFIRFVSGDFPGVVHVDTSCLKDKPATAIDTCTHGCYWRWH